MKKKYFYLLIIFGAIQIMYAQDSEPYVPALKYDLKTQTLLEKAVIPFDKEFNLHVEKIPTKIVKRVQAFQTISKAGIRQYKENIFKDCNTNEVVSKVVMDVELQIDEKSEYLIIKFPALKPNIDFAVHIVTELDPDSKNNLMLLNTALSRGGTGNIEFKKAVDATVYKSGNFELSYFSMDLNGYTSFYTTKLKSKYDSIKNLTNFKTTAVIRETSIQAFDGSTSKNVWEPTEGFLLLETSKKRQFSDILLGFRDINNVLLPDTEKTVANINSPEQRLANLKNNIKYFDEVQKKITGVIAKGLTSFTVGGSAINLNLVKTEVETFRAQLQENYSLLDYVCKYIDKEITASDKMKQVLYLSSSTQSVDLKTAGGHILFLDAGFANVFATDLNNKITYIPKLYLGFSIYFRPIDRNTRRGKFISDFDPKLNKGCVAGKYGPDYDIVSHWSIWQHLCLNIGLTFGSMSNIDFDNFYNSNSLLIGPGYRFAQVLKISGGVALLKRASTNPLISDKHIAAGAYLSLSVDIDFLSSIEKVTNLVLK
ncbi:hypothetical protein [Flavobacterium sp. PS2]|uniref:hypothetical protein n=1 Tax=Flavobacterium sp. PS2 TaxID=3384157 RepID=UPI00390CB98B